MNYRLFPLRLLGLMFLVNGAFSSVSWAQGDEPTIKFQDGSSGIKVDFLDVPLASNPAPTPTTDSRKWMKIDLVFLPDSPTEVIPEAKFKIYAEVPDVKGPRDSRVDKFVILTGETTFVNIPSTGRELHASFFVHPFTINRYGGEKNFHFSQSQNIHVDAYIGEQKVASKDFYDVAPADKNWYQSESEKKVPGFLLTKEQSPWAPYDAATYPQAKIKTASGE